MGKKTKRKHDEKDGFSSLDAFDEGFGAMPHREDSDPGDSVVNDPYAPDYSNDHPFEEPPGGTSAANASSRLEGLPALNDADVGRSASRSHTGALASDFDDQLDAAFGKAGQERFVDDDFFAAEEEAWNNPQTQYASMEEERELEESLRKRKRLIRAIVILVVLAILCVGGLMLYSKSVMARTSSKQQDISVSNDQTSASSTVAKATIPNLVALYGKNTDEVLAALGSSASLSTSEADASSQSVTIKFAPNENTSTAETSSAKLYLIEDSSGNVNDITYSATLDDLGYINDSFSQTLADTAFIEKTLKAAGANVSNLTLQQPDASSYQTMGTSSQGTQYVQTEEYTFSGSTNVSAPANWSVKFTFDHSVSAETKTSKSLTRLMTIHLS